MTHHDAMKTKRATIAERNKHRDLYAFVATDTFDVIVERIRNLVESGRRMSIISWYDSTRATPDFKVGLTIDPEARDGGILITEGGYQGHRSLVYCLTPGLDSFGISVNETIGTEEQAAARWNADPKELFSRRKDVTRVEITGGWSPDRDQQGRDDEIRIDRVNEYGVQHTTVIRFDTPWGIDDVRAQAPVLKALADNAPEGGWTTKALTELAGKLAGYYRCGVEEYFDQYAKEDH